jgi:hypothetical protein
VSPGFAFFVLAIVPCICIDYCIEQSSQWDGLRHFSQTVPGQSERVFYGGTTVEEINDRQNDRIGLQHWAREGIAGMNVSPIYLPVSK